MDLEVAALAVVIPAYLLLGACSSGGGIEVEGDDSTGSNPDTPGEFTCEPGEMQFRGTCWTRHDLGQVATLSQLAVYRGDQNVPPTILARVEDGQYRGWRYAAIEFDNVNFGLAESMGTPGPIVFGSFSEPGAAEAVVFVGAGASLVDLSSFESASLDSPMWLGGFGRLETIGPGPDGRHRLLGSSGPPSEWGVAVYGLEGETWVAEWKDGGSPGLCGATSVIVDEFETAKKHAYVHALFRDDDDACESSTDSLTFRLTYTSGAVEFTPGVERRIDALLRSESGSHPVSIGPSGDVVVYDSPLQTEGEDFAVAGFEPGTTFRLHSGNLDDDEGHEIVVLSGDFFAGEAAFEVNELQVEPLEGPTGGRFELVDLNLDGVDDLVVQNGASLEAWISEAE